MIHLDAVSKEGKPRPSQRWEETTRMVRGRADLGEAAGVEDGCFCRRLKNEDFSVGTEAAWYGRWRWQVCMHGGREACGPNHDKDNMLDWPIMLPRGPSAVPMHDRVTQSYKFIRGDGCCRTRLSVRSGGQGRQNGFFFFFCTGCCASGVDSFSQPSVLYGLK